MFSPVVPSAAGPVEAATTRPAAVGRALSPFLRLFMVVILTLVGTAGTMFAGATAANAAGPRLTAFDDRMLDLVNTARVNAGVSQVQAAVGLTNLSLSWSGKMADGATNYELKHNPDGFEQTLRFGAANRTSWAENVAKWTPTSTTADAIFKAYMDSPGHRANILGGNYRYIGIASVSASNGASFNTMTFTDKVEAGQEYSTPRGSTDSVTVVDATIRLSGWAFDPNNSSASIPVHVYVNGAFSSQLSASAGRADVNSAYGIPGNHGFSGTVRAAVGDNTVCVFALSVTGTDNSLLLCKTVNWNPTKPPVGSFDGISLDGSTIAVSGWTYDPQNVSASNTVSVKLNGGAATTVTANGSRSDVNSALGLTGSHGYSTSLTARAGANQVCVTATTVNGQATADLGCKSVTYTPPLPAVGSIDVVARTGSSIAVSGWAYDPSNKAISNQVHVYVNGVGTQLFADKSRTDVNAAFGLTGNHGFANTVPAPSGAAEVCMFSISMSGGDNTLLGCRTLAAPVAATGSLDQVTRTANGISVGGWALDPSSSSSANQVHVYLNGAGVAQITTNVQRNDVNGAFGISGTHGFNTTVAYGGGAVSACVFSISISGGANTLLGCKNL